MLDELFSNPVMVAKIQKRLPEMFYIAELESSRAGKVGMEVGSVREKILISLFIYAFGRERVDTNLPIHEPETDVLVDGVPISIKTITRKQIGGVKLIWTVDREQVIDFAQTYEPQCDMLLVHINWDEIGGVYYFPRAIQYEVMIQLGRE
jgi:hypothetical protein